MPPVTPLAVHIAQASYSILAFSVVVRALFFWWLLSGRRAQRLERRIAARIHHPLLANGVAIAAYASLYLAAGLPARLAGYLTFHHFGIIVQDAGPWLRDVLQSWLVALVVAVPALLIVLRLQQRLPRGWWVAATGLAAVLTGLLVYAAPLVIDPLFHHFTPLHNPVLQRQILDLGRRAGVRVSGVYVGAFSATTTEGNAYVTGLGGSHRIVLWDTLLKAFPPGPLRSIIAHELGHYALHHILFGVAAAIAGSAFIFLACAFLLSWLEKKRTGYARGRAGALAPLAALVVLLNLLTLPLQNGVSRVMEAQADDFSLTITRDPANFIASMQRLCVQDHDDPWPNHALVFAFYTHPPISERIHAAVCFAEQSGLPLYPASAL